MATDLGEAFAAVASGYAADYRSDRRERERYSRDLLKNQLIASALAPIAGAVGQGVTDLVSAPFKEPMKNYLATDRGRLLKTIFQQQKLAAASNKKFDDAFKGQTRYSTREEFLESNIRDRINEQGIAEFGEERWKTFDPKAKQEAIKNSYARELKEYQFNRKFSTKEFGDKDDLAVAIKKYSDEPTNVGSYVYKRFVRPIFSSQTDEQRAENAYISILEDMGYSDYNIGTKGQDFSKLKTDVEAALAETQQKINAGVSLDNEQLLKEIEIQADASGNESFRYMAKYKIQVDKMISQISSSPTLQREYNRFLAQEDGNVTKAYSALMKQISQNARMTDFRTPTIKNEELSVFKSSADNQKLIEKLQTDLFIALQPNEKQVTVFTDLTVDERKELYPKVEKQYNATIDAMYSIAVQNAELQISTLQYENPKQYSGYFEDETKGRILKSQLVRENMKTLLDTALATEQREKKNFYLDPRKGDELTIQNGFIDLSRQQEMVGNYLTFITSADQNKEETPADIGQSTSAPTPAELAAEEVTASEKVIAQARQNITTNSQNVTEPEVESNVEERLVSMVKNPSTRRSAMKQIRTAVHSNLQQLKDDGLTGDDLIAKAKELSQVDVAGYGELDVLGGPKSGFSVFANDGDTVTFSDKSFAKYDKGKVTIKTNKNDQINSISEIPDSSIKDYLRSLQITFNENIDKLKSLGVEGKGLTNRDLRPTNVQNNEIMALKSQNNEIIGSINFTTNRGKKDSSRVVSFLLEDRPFEKQVREKDTKPFVKQIDKVRTARAAKKAIEGIPDRIAATESLLSNPNESAAIDEQIAEQAIDINTFNDEERTNIEDLIVSIPKIRGFENKNFISKVLTPTLNKAVKEGRISDKGKTYIIDVLS